MKPYRVNQFSPLRVRHSTLRYDYRSTAPPEVSTPPSPRAQLEMDSSNTWDGERQREIEKRFAHLVAEWREAIRHTSDSREITSNQSFLYLVGMGRDAIRPALRSLATEPSQLVRVLRYVAAPENPVKQEHAGNIQLITLDWVAWGLENRYLD